MKGLMLAASWLSCAAMPAIDGDLPGHLTHKVRENDQPAGLTALLAAKASRPPFAPDPLNRQDRLFSAAPNSLITNLAINPSPPAHLWEMGQTQVRGEGSSHTAWRAPFRFGSFLVVRVGHQARTADARALAWPPCQIWRGLALLPIRATKFIEYVLC